MTPADSLPAFEAYAASRGTDLQAGSLSEVVETVLLFYSDRRAVDLTGEDADMLLFQYGCYDFGDGEWFTFDVTRQFISALEEDDAAISQLHVTFRYALDEELRSLGAFNQWCHSSAELTRFRETVLSSPAFAAASKRQPAQIDVSWEQV